MQRAPLSFIFLACLSMLPGCGGGGGGGGGDFTITPFTISGGIAVADLNGDGKLDVAVAQTYIAGPPPHTGYVRVYLQSATRSFAAHTDYTVGPDPSGLGIGDFDGDGRLDLVAATSMTAAPRPNTISNDGGIAILRQDAAHAGTFLPMQWIATGSAPTDAGFAQLTPDTLADVIVADGVLVSGRAQLLAQNPAAPGTTLAPVSLSTGSGNGSDDLAVGDVNGDGLADVVLAAANVVSIFYQQAGGGFAPVLNIGTGIRVSGVALGDVDGDGRADIVVANAGNAPSGGTGGSTVTLLRQTTPGIFQATHFPVWDGARRVAIADLNGDGIPDIAAVSLVYQVPAPSRISVLLQSATARGQFSGALYDGPFSGDDIAVGDINGDGLNDIVVNDGPVVLLQRAAAHGTFEPLRALP